MGFIATLAVVELVGFVIIDRNARSSQIAQYSAMQQSDVKIFETIGRRSMTTASILIGAESEAVAVTTADEKAAVRRMLDERGLDVHFQPIWNLTTCELIGVEALARPHATYDLEGPQEAFDIAEQLGRTHELDELCASTAFAQADRLPSGVALFVNVCPQTLDLDADENDWFLADVERAGLTPEQVVVEVPSASAGGPRRPSSACGG